MIKIPVNFQYFSIVFRNNLSKFVSNGGCRITEKL